MDKNQFIGFALMFAVLVMYFTFFYPDTPESKEETTVHQETSQKEQQVNKNFDTLKSEPIKEVDSDLIQNAINDKEYGVFAFAVNGQEETQSIENENLIFSFSNKGGKIKNVTLKNHKNYIGNLFQLMDQSKSFSQLLIQYEGKPIDLSQLYFESKKSVIDDTTILIYSLKNEYFSFDQIYKLPDKGHEIIYTTQTSRMNEFLDPVDIAFNWQHTINRAEKNIEDERINANVRYFIVNDGVDELSESSQEFEEAKLSQTKWVSFKQKFFTAGIVANKSFKSGYVTSAVNLADTASIKNLAMQLFIPYSDFINGFSGKYFFGPNNYNILKKVSPDFEDNLDIGWGPLPLVNKYLIIPIFHFLEGFFSNYGIIIVIVVIIIRLLLSPLTYKSHISMAKMRVLKPELDELKKKNGGNAQKMQQEQMKLYQKVGINPLSGCIPLLLQMPVLFSLFFFFPNSVELRQESFLWAHDLSTYDSIITFAFSIPFYGDHVSLFTLLMTVSTILITVSNSEMTTVQGPMKTMQYIMPIMFLFVLNSYASGLTFYYFISNMVTYGQTVLFRKLINEDKVKKILDENRKKNVNKKKSKFQLKLEEAMKTKQETKKKHPKKRIR